ncbi:MAG: DNA-binding protein [Candidatus Bathyarchaeia archaeon]
MSNDLTIELLKRKKLAELQKKFMAEKKEKVQDKKINVEEELKKVFVGRAWEVFQAAQIQYPEVTKKIGEWLAQLVNEGKIKKSISGEQLFLFFRRLGLNVKLKTEIRILEDGELRSLADKLRDKLR